MKILTSKQVREADQFTIENEPVFSIDLMERACEAFVSEFTELFDPGPRVTIVSGPGNNGGDGLGIARLLADEGFEISIFIFPSKNYSEDFKINLDRLPTHLKPVEITEKNYSTIEGEIIIDAIFGSGLSRKPEGLYYQVIQHINQLNSIRYSVDIPSGLFADSHSEGIVIDADFTISFEVPKLAFFMPECSDYTGNWMTVTIGLDYEFINNLQTPYSMTTREEIVQLIDIPSKFSHKGTQGHILLIGGSTGKAGAMILASRAALRSGCGLLTSRIPFNCLIPLQASIPEAMCLPDDYPDHLAGALDTVKYDALGVGPGMGQHPQTVDFLKSILEKIEKPLVLDADALNIISENKELLGLGAGKWIITPHPGEFRRLFGSWKNDFARLDLQRQMSKKYGLVIVLKGANTSVSDADGNIYFNSTGNSGMATAGSGDALTGIITSLCGQGYSLIDSAKIGVYLHGLAGDLAVLDKSHHSLIASDIIDYLSEAFTDLFDESDSSFEL